MKPPSAIRVGGEIDALCNRCELNLAHTIVAMVGTKVIKVKCNTCGSDHQYRGEQPLVKALSFAAPKKSASGAKPRASASTSKASWEDKFQGKDISRPKRYSPAETFAEDDVVDHPTFGLGLVVHVRGDKVDISFKQAERTLVHGKGAARSTTAPEAPTPREPAGGSERS